MSDTKPHEAQEFSEELFYLCKDEPNPTNELYMFLKTTKDGWTEDIRRSVILTQEDYDDLPDEVKEGATLHSVATVMARVEVQLVPIERTMRILLGDQRTDEILAEGFVPPTDYD